MSVIAAKKFGFVFQTHVKSLFLFKKPYQEINMYWVGGGVEEQQMHTEKKKKHK